MVYWSTSLRLKVCDWSKINFRFNLIFFRIICVSDFCCGDVSVNEKSLSNCSNKLCDTSTIHDDSNRSVNADAECERDYDSPEEEISDLITSLEPSQQNLSLSKDSETDNMLVKTSTNISSDSWHDATLTNTLNETCPNTPSNTNSPIIPNIDNTISSNNNDSEDQCLNNNIKGNIDVGSLLDSPPESVNSKGRRYIFIICDIIFI